jgi:threonine aldolase
MEAWLAGGLWLDLARRANAAARRLAEGLAAAPGLRLAFPVEANEVFVVAPDPTLARWRAAGVRFHEWSTRSAPPERAPRPGETMVRLVASFETGEAEVQALLALAESPQRSRNSWPD